MKILRSLTEPLSVQNWKNTYPPDDMSSSEDMYGLCRAQQASARQTRHGIGHRYPSLLLDTQGRVFCGGGTGFSAVLGFIGEGGGGASFLLEV